MLDRTGNYDICINPDAHWILVSAPLSWIGDSNRCIPISSAESLLRGKEVQSIFLESDALTAEQAIPPFVRELPWLRRLSLPSQIASSLTPDMLPESVKELRFFGRYDKRYWQDKTVRLGRTRPFPSIEYLTGDIYCYRSEARFEFEAMLFPSLLAIGFTFDQKGHFGDTLRRLSGLTTVSAAAFDSIEQLADLLPTANIVSLTLAWNRRIENLQGIERFHGLRFLTLTSLTKLRSLDGLHLSQNLEYLGVFYSKRLEDVTALSELRNLRQISTIASDNHVIDWSELSKRIAANCGGLDPWEKG